MINLLKWHKGQSLLEGKTLLFLHIPKCAGTTLVEEIIKGKFPHQELIVFYEAGTEALIERLRAMSPKDQKKIRCIAGHFAFGIHEYYAARPTTYVTLLRNPVERVISHYYYVLREKKHYLHKTVVEKKYTLRQYVESKVTTELNNGQTRLLAGIGWGADFGNCPRTMFEKAKRNLEEHFSAVGVSERFNPFLELLHHKTGWKFSGYEDRNVSDRSVSANKIENKTREVITEYNRLDIDLYNYAQSMFEREYSSTCK